MKNNNKYSTAKDCSNFLYDEMRKELIGPSDGLFNRSVYKKKEDELEIINTPSLSFSPFDPNLHKQEVKHPSFLYVHFVTRLQLE